MRDTKKIERDFDKLNRCPHLRRGGAHLNTKFRGFQKSVDFYGKRAKMA